MEYIIELSKTFGSNSNYSEFDTNDKFSLVASKEFADHLDQLDEISFAKKKFLFPSCPENITHTHTHTHKPAIYLCGNSLGLQPVGLKEEINKQLNKWSKQGVEGHFTEPTPWLTIDDTVTESMAKLVGALPSEIVVMNSLTCNLHLMMIAFYRPTSLRHKIMIEKKAFPSDIHAVVSQIYHHGYEPSDALIEISPREGEHCIREEDIEDMLRLHGQSISLVLFSGVQYYTGQLFDMKRITQLAKAQGCNAGFDLAHAVGNVPLELHAWNCDFAVWCTYKYMNCGPGSIGGCFVHEVHGSGTLQQPVHDSEYSNRLELPRLSGWWGHRQEDRFLMAPKFTPCIGAHGFRLSNPPVLLIACVRASLDIFDEVGIDRLRDKSILLTGYLEYLIRNGLSPSEVEILTPSDPTKRGCQLSLLFPQDIDTILSRLLTAGIICDARKPNVIRIAPAPLYNTFADVQTFFCELLEILRS